MQEKEIKINNEFIPATSLLKLADAASTGGAAGIMILDGMVKADGKVLTEKRKKIYPGMTVEVKDIMKIKVLSES